tara:strand:- start:240 stop:497 length:258 start_codon:yes stop_codon:yes gene_type:complete
VEAGVVLDTITTMPTETVKTVVQVVVVPVEMETWVVQEPRVKVLMVRLQHQVIIVVVVAVRVKPVRGVLIVRLEQMVVMVNRPIF